jgi:hypothetical protein
MAKERPLTPAQISSIRAITSKYGHVLRQHMEKDHSVILHCQRHHEFSAHLFRIHPNGVTDLI